MLMLNSSMAALAASLSQQLMQVKELAQEYVAALAVPAQLLCGLFAFIYIGVRLWGQWARGQKIDFYGLLRPFAVGLVVLFFSGFVALLGLSVYPIELATSSLNSAVQPNYQQAQQAYQQANNTMRNAMAAYQRTQVEQEEVDVDQVTTEAEQGGNYLHLFKTSVHLLVSFSSLVLTGMVYFFRIFVVLATIVLSLIGPFAFALSLLPGFENNIRNWMVHYLRIAMYVPLSLLVSFVVAVLFSGCVYPYFTQLITALPSANYTFANYETAQNVGFSIQLITLLFNCIAIALYACIPTFSTWIIRSESKANAK